MKSARLAALPIILTSLFMTGCASRTYYAAAPPPPPYNGFQSAPPLIERADHEGFRIGSEAGARDAYNGFGHHPQRDRNFHDTPGYDPAMGPYSAYRDAFRRSYLRGYDAAYYRR
jgi:hypothetical protein